MDSRISIADLDPANPKLSTGTPEDMETARQKWLRDKFASDVFRSSLEEIPRSALKPFRYGIVEDDSGTFYTVRRDGLLDFLYAGDAVAYYCDESGIPVLLVPPPSGYKNRAELKQRQTEREQRRNPPKRRRQAPRR